MESRPVYGNIFYFSNLLLGVRRRLPQIGTIVADIPMDVNG